MKRSGRFGPYLSCTGYSIKTEKGELVQPSLEAARAGTYPLSRRFDMVSANRPHGEVRKVIEFMQGAEGQQILRQNDLVPAEAAESKK